MAAFVHAAELRLRRKSLRLVLNAGHPPTPRCEQFRFLREKLTFTARSVGMRAWRKNDKRLRTSLQNAIFGQPSTFQGPPLRIKGESSVHQVKMALAASPVHFSLHFANPWPIKKNQGRLLSLQSDPRRRKKTETAGLRPWCAS